MATVKLIDEAGASELLGVKRSTLRAWRCLRTVRLPYCKIGRRVLYKQADLEAFIEANTVDDPAAVSELAT